MTGKHTINISINTVKIEAMHCISYERLAIGERSAGETETATLSAQHGSALAHSQQAGVLGSQNAFPQSPRLLCCCFHHHARSLSSSPAQVE